MDDKRLPVKLIQLSSMIIGKYFVGLTYEESMQLIEAIKKEIEIITMEPKF